MFHYHIIQKITKFQEEIIEPHAEKVLPKAEMGKRINKNHIEKMFQLLIYFVASALVLTNIENNGNYNLAVGGKVAIDKNWWISITGISKRFLNKGQSRQLYNHDVNISKDTNRRNGEPANLHKGEFCVDVSTYSEIKYDNATIKLCDSTFAKKCTNKFKEVLKNEHLIFL